MQSSSCLSLVTSWYSLYQPTPVHPFQLKGLDVCVCYVHIHTYIHICIYIYIKQKSAIGLIVGAQEQKLWEFYSWIKSESTIFYYYYFIYFCLGRYTGIWITKLSKYLHCGYRQSLYCRSTPMALSTYLQFL